MDIPDHLDSVWNRNELLTLHPAILCGKKYLHKHDQKKLTICDIVTFRTHLATD